MDPAVAPWTRRRICPIRPLTASGASKAVRSAVPLILATALCPISQRPVPVHPGDRRGRCQPYWSAPEKDGVPAAELRGPDAGRGSIRAARPESSGTPALRRDQWPCPGPASMGRRGAWPGETSLLDQRCRAVLWGGRNALPRFPPRRRSSTTIFQCREPNPPPGKGRRPIV